MATEAEIPACLALLPECWEVPGQVLIARLKGAFAGAAILHWRSWAEPPGFPLWLRVAQPFQRLGVGRSLVGAAAALAGPEVGGLWAVNPVDVDSVAARFLAACGFAARARTSRFRAPAAVLLDQIAPIMDRAQSRGGSLREFRIEPLTNSTVNDAAWLLANELTGGPSQAHALLRRRMAAALGADWSTVALHGDELVGLVVCRLEEGRGVIDARVVHPKWRGGPLNLLMLHHLLVAFIGQGGSDFEFVSNELNRDTLSLARRAGAVQVDEELSFHRPARM